MSEPCSIERTPARIATLIPRSPWAWAATNEPWAAASSTAAADHRPRRARRRPGRVPRVRTAPVTMQLDQVGAARDELADLRSRTSAGDRGRRRTGGPSGRPTSRASAGDLAAAAGRGDVRAGALHPRARRSSRVDRVAQRDVDERPVRADVADGREPGLERRRGRCGRRSSPPGPALDVVAGTPANSMSPTRWLWQSIRPGRMVRPGQVERPGAVGRRHRRRQDRPRSAPSTTRSRRSPDHRRASTSRRCRAADDEDRRPWRPIATSRPASAMSPDHDRHDRRDLPVHRRRRGRPPASSASRSRCSSASSSTSR